MGRTYLTVPPGVEPTADVGTSGDTETYVPALAAPSEPRVPGRFRRARVTLGVIVLLAALAWAWYRIATTGQDFDPALDPAFQQPGPGEVIDDDGQPLLPD